MRGGRMSPITLLKKIFQTISGHGKLNRQIHWKAFVLKTPTTLGKNGNKSIVNLWAACLHLLPSITLHSAVKAVVSWFETDSTNSTFAASGGELKLLWVGGRGIQKIEGFASLKVTDSCQSTEEMPIPCSPSHAKIIQGE